MQPVLDKYCVGCHDGRPTAGADTTLDLRVNGSASFRNFTPSYVALHPYVRRPGPESDYHLQMPLEFHAGTSELIQRLEQGHHNVQLDAEAWDRLVTWIDLNVPDHGNWTEQTGGPRDVMKRRLAMRTQVRRPAGRSRGRDCQPAGGRDVRRARARVAAHAASADRGLAVRRGRGASTSGGGWICPRSCNCRWRRA